MTRYDCTTADGVDDCLRQTAAARAAVNATTTAIMHELLPDELILTICGFCAPRCLCTLERVSRALLVKDQNRRDAAWRDQLCTQWPREGPVLCKLRPRLTARQLFRAFATKRDARTQIMRRPERVAVTADDRRRLQQEDLAAYDADDERLAYLICVGPVAGLVRWMPVPNGPRSKLLMPGLRWQPETTESSLAIELPEEVSSFTQERYGDQLAQTLHVIDMRTHKCVTIFRDVVPEQIEMDTDDGQQYHLSQLGDVTTYSPYWHSVRHNYMDDIDRDGANIDEDDPRLHSWCYDGIEHCVVDPILRFRMSSGTLRLRAVDLPSLGYDTATVLHHCSVHGYFVDMIAQTFEAGWKRVPQAEPYTNLADNRPEVYTTAAEYVPPPPPPNWWDEVPLDGSDADLRAHLAHMREELERLYERRAAVNAEIQDMEARLGEARIEGE